MKKGMSDVVTTVLIILFAIIAVVVVGGIVMNQVGKTGEKIASASICSELEVEPVRCSNDITTGAYVVVQRGSGGADIKLSNVAALFEKADGTIDTTYIADVSTFKPLTSAKLFSHSIIDNVKKVGLSVEITDDKDSKSSCNYYKTIKEDCFKGDETPSLIGYWPFDTSGDYKDYSGNGYTLTPTVAGSAPTFNTIGAGNGYLDFGIDGTDKSLKNLEFKWSTQQVTVSFWSYVPTSIASEKLYPTFGVGLNDNPYNSFNGRVSFEYSTYWDYGDYRGIGRIKVVYSNIPPPGNIACQNNNCYDKWSHIVLVSNGVNSKKIYINGVLVSSGSPAGHPEVLLGGAWVDGQLDSIFIGKTKADILVNQLYFKGNLDEFMIYNQVLTDAEINRIYNLQRSKFGV